MRKEIYKIKGANYKQVALIKNRNINIDKKERLMTNQKKDE